MSNTNAQPSPSSEKKTRQAFMLSLITTVLMFAIVVFFLVTDGFPTSLFEPVSMAALIALAAVASMWLARQSRATTGIWLILAALLFAVLITAVQTAGYGFLLGVFLVAATFGIASPILPHSQFVIANVLGVMTALAMILLDIFEPYERSEAYISNTVTWSIVGILILIYAVFILRQFREYQLRTKLAVAFVALTLLVVGALAFYTQSNLTTILTENLGREMQNLATQRAVRIGDLLNEELNSLTTLSVDRVLQQAAEDQNESYQGDADAIAAALEELDQQWRAADAADNNDDPLVSDRLTNDVAVELREYQQLFPDNAEIFITDRYGALVASTNRTSDYYQADEGWWQAAWNDGQGAEYISDPVFDESVGSISVLVAIPLRRHDGDEVVGVFRTTYLMSAMIDILGEPIRETGEADLFIPGDPVQHFHIEEGEYKPAQTDLYEEVVAIGDQPIVEMVYEGQDSVVSHDRIHTLEGNPTIDNLGWVMSVHLEADEAFRPLENQTRGTLVLAIIVTAVAVAAAVGISQLLVAPLSQLTEVAEAVSAGDLDARATVETGDEVGVLAKVFNTMTAQLQSTLRGLEDRVAERTRDLELAAEVGRRLSFVRDPEPMLTEAVETIRERFDLYYTQIYLTDPTGRNLELRAGTGEAGQTLLRRGHRLPVDLSSLNGVAVVERRAVIVEDTETSDIHRPNPLLPETRSEMAIPLIAGERVLGVLDMQSSRPGALNEENLTAFEALASQLAITIVNSELFSEIESARQQVEAQARRLTRDGWESFLDAIQRPERFGYRFEEDDLEPLDQPLTGALDDGDSMVIPIQVAGQSVGSFQLEGRQNWSREDIEMVEDVAQQVGQQIENLRLLAQSQRYQQEAQEAVRRLTREGWQKAEQFLSELGYIYTGEQVKPLSQVDDDGHDEDWVFDIKISDESIGQIGVKDTDELSAEGADFIAAISEQLAVHIENLRLTEQTQNQAQREQALRQITSAVRGSTDPENIMRTAVRELGRVLGRRAVVRLQRTNDDDSGQNE